MRREWLIVAAVLGPFAVLVAVGFLRQPTVSPPLLPTEPPGVRAPTALPTALPTAMATAMAPLGASDAGRGAEAIEPAIEAPVRAVEREVQACFADNGAHLHGRQALRVAFQPTREGTFRDVTLEGPIVVPQLRACLEDVFAEMRFAPTGRETFEPAKYTFIFDAPQQ